MGEVVWFMGENSMNDGFDIDPQTLLDVLQETVAQQAIRIAYLEAAVKMLRGDDDAPS